MSLRDLKINLNRFFECMSSLHLREKVHSACHINMNKVADQGLDKVFPVPDGFADALRKGWMDQKGTIVCVEGDHHVHLNKPESVAPIITDFLQSSSPDSTESDSDSNQSAKF
ncbi:serine hydrolase-like protein [Myxocyprinus asiaticus]|uniref:serine hydrolase-like protein n=1 Tax=Myxocyprinus asiaticus TaxID=70543 RepID=UPI002223BE08|nr:serine hydrolase-like protein [Myxocyprinus asiaticus]